jgi:hypothetical protein
MYLLSEMRDYLVAQGIARKPTVAGGLPPMFIHPRDGVRAPGEGQGVEIGTNAVLGVFHSGGLPMRPYESFLRRDTVDLWIRCLSAPTAFDIEFAVRTVIVDKRNWLMGAMTVLESLEWRPLQQLSSDSQGFTFIVSYLIWRYSKDG